MRNKRRASIQVEPIESRSLLSAVAPAPMAVAGEVSTRIFPPPLLVTGAVRGTARIQLGMPDVGDLYTLKGSGRVGPLGQVDARGSVQTSSFTGQPLGTVILSNRFGVVRLSVTGSPATAGAATPGDFNFEVTRATGRYARLLGTDGVFELAVGRAGRNGRANFRLDINPVVILSR